MIQDRELDALVDKHVMGDDFRPHEDHLIRHYSTDIAAAWEVVEKIDDGRRPYQVFQMRRVGASWGATFDPTWAEFECAETAARAICLAALASCGVSCVFE